MSAQDFKRKLTAVFSADVAGYSRLMRYIRLGQEKEAQAAAAEILRLNPKFSLERYAKMLPFPQPIADLVINDLRKAGLK